MKREVKQYDEEFKKSSVELFFKSGKKQKPFSGELGVSPETFRGWVKKYGEAYEPEPKTDQERLNCLRRKLFEKEMENDLLKKTIAIFCKNLV